MKTTLDCLPCLYKQALYTARLCTDSEPTHRQILIEVSKILNNLDLETSPPENSIKIYDTVASLSQVSDPFLSLKKEANNRASKLANGVRNQINSSKDPILTAIKYAIAGNIIDYGSHQDFDIEKTISNSLKNELTINHYNHFCDTLNKSKTILYLGDNTGELVFDRILIQLLKRKVYFSVKESPIINDALMDDAIYCGLNEDCKVVSNGTNCPGTPLAKCSPEFQSIFHSADMIISKGQGNFETLSEEETPIFFLMTVKCPVVGRHVAQLVGEDRPVEVGSSVLLTNNHN